MRRRLLTVAVFALLITLGLIVFTLRQPPANRVFVADQSESLALPEASIILGGESFTVELAKTAESVIRGLSKRSFLPNNRGILLVFGRTGYHGIWMKEMRFSLDIVWIDEEGVVVDLRENVSPETFPEVFSPISPARYVLEVNAGVVGERNVRIGSRILPPVSSL